MSEQHLNSLTVFTNYKDDCIFHLFKERNFLSETFDISSLFVYFYFKMTYRARNIYCKFINFTLKVDAELSQFKFQFFSWESCEQHCETYFRSKWSLEHNIRTLANFMQWFVRFNTGATKAQVVLTCKL